MAYTRAWRDFRRMQDVALGAASLIYAGAVVNAYQVLPGGSDLVTQRAVIWPAGFMLMSFSVPLLVGPLKRGLVRYVWMSFRAGFGQTPFSVISGIGLLAAAALFVYWQVAQAGHGGRYPAGVFSAYGAGIGVMTAQVVLVRVLEQLPDIRKLIVEPD